jgi:hypothetical protein
VRMSLGLWLICSIPSFSFGRVLLPRTGAAAS